MHLINFSSVYPPYMAFQKYRWLVDAGVSLGNDLPGGYIVGAPHELGRSQFSLSTSSFLDLKGTKGGGREEESSDDEAEGADGGRRLDARGGVVGVAGLGAGGRTALGSLGAAAGSLLIIVVVVRALASDGAGRGGRGHTGIGGRRLGDGGADDVAKGGGVAGALAAEAPDEVVGALAEGGAVHAAVVAVGDDAGVLAAGLEDVGVVAAKGEGAGGRDDGDVVEEGAAVGDGGGGGGGGDCGGHDGRWYGV